MAQGRLGDEQLRALDQSLAQAPGFRCVLLHHPPLPGGASWRKRLRDAHALQRVLEGMAQGVTGDFLAMDIRQALHYLGEITGTITTEDLLENIFSRFCIGKSLSGAMSIQECRDGSFAFIIVQVNQG